MTTRSERGVVWALAIALAAVSSGTSAQARRPGNSAANASATGIELELHGSAVALAGRTLELRGVTFSVVDLATLRALPHAHLEARLDLRGPPARNPAPVALDAGADGRFTLSIPVPEVDIANARVLIDVTDGRATRRFEQSVRIQPPLALDLMTDRVLYEPGEVMHVWARLLDRASQAPIASRAIALRVSTGDATGDVVSQSRAVTSAMGVVAFDIPLEADAGEGSLDVRVTSADGGLPLAASTTARVGRRSLERMMVHATFEHDVVRPGEVVRGTVTVRAASGAPVRDATVELRRGRQTLTVHTGPDGTASFSWTAPVFEDRDFGGDPVDIRAVHPAVGSVRAHAYYTVARTPFAVAGTVGHGGAIPEIDSPFYIVLTDPQGNPAPAGTRIVASGRVVARGRFEATTDAHGFVTVPIHAPLDAIAEHESGSCAGGAAGTIAIDVLAREAFTTRLCVPVSRAALVAVEALSPIATPGGEVHVRVTRRHEARTRSVALDLLEVRGRSTPPIVLASTMLPSDRGDAVLRVPLRVVGPVIVRARPVLAAHTAEGVGSADAVLVRPAHAFDLRLTTERPLYRPRETARIVAQTSVAGAPGAIALVVRDLSAHAGERDFALAWLDGALEQAVTSPLTTDGDRLVRAALTAMLSDDARPGEAEPLVDSDGAVPTALFHEGSPDSRGDVRDPFARRDDFLRRALTPVFRALEVALERATEGTVTGLVVRREGRAAFATDVIRQLVDNGDLTPGNARTLGDAPLTVDMLLRSDLGFDFDRAARRVARARLVRLLAALLTPVDPGGDTRSPLSSDTPDRWLSRLISWGRLSPNALRDPWGGSFALRRARVQSPAISLGASAAGWELASPGPDGVFDTGDDVRDPLARAVPQGTTYAVVSDEDDLMRRLAALDPANDALAAMVLAYRRIGAAAHEEEIGDIALAGDSTGDAFGYGGLGMTGTGSGGGGSGFGTIGMGSVGTIGHGSGTGPIGQLASLLRERFPATLMFVAERAIDPSGRTVFDVPLADALTTFRIEAIAWTAEGWTSSARVEVRVDQDVVVEAPVPGIAAPGDVLRLPVRVANRGDHAVRVRTSVVLEGGLEGRVEDSPPVSVNPGDAVESVVVVRVGHAARGTMRVTAVDPASNAVLDAVRRPMTVIAAARPEATSVESLVDNEAVFHLRVAPDATYRADGAVRVSVGSAIDESPTTWSVSDPSWSAWAAAMAGESLSGSLHGAAMGAGGGDSPERIARAVGALWTDERESDASIERRMEQLTVGLDPRTPPTMQGPAVEVLVGLIPAITQADRRPSISAALATLTTRLRRTIERDTARLADRPDVFALAAYALRVTGRGSSARADEFLRRAWTGVQTHGEDRFVAGAPGSPDERVAHSCAFALALLAGNDRAGAFRFARDLLDRATIEGLRDGRARALMHALLARLTVSPPAGTTPRATFDVDGHSETVDVREGSARIAAAVLSQPGDHVVRVRLSSPAVLRATAIARFGRPWNAPLVARAPLEITIDGPQGARDTRAAFVLRVRNRGPRVLARVVVRVEIPAGGELDVDARRDLSARLASTAVLEDRSLTLALRALAPGGTVRLPLRVRWTVGGALQGLGVVARVDEAPDAPASVLAPRIVQIDDRGGEPEPLPGRNR